MNGGGYFIDSDGNGLGQCLVLTGPWRDELADLMSSRGLSLLRLSSSVGWNGDDISFVSRLKFLTGLEVYSWNIKDVSPLFQLAGLRYVGLQCEFTSKADFGTLTGLEILKLFWRPKVTGVEHCTNLRHLNVVNYPHDDLSEWISLVNVQRLQITSNKLLSLRGIEAMSRLKNIDVAKCPKLNDIARLATCNELQSMTFTACRRLSQLPTDLCLDSLQEVSLEDCGTIRTLRPLAQCKNLKILRFVGDTTITDGDFNFLLQHPSLKEIWYANRSHYTLTREELAEKLALRPADANRDTRHPLH